jgi:anaerobic ribonucleoside-triphosphate reductase activating protein
MIFQLNKIQYPIYNLGPGKRMGIWLQGCSIHCKDCINTSTWSKKDGKEIHIIDLYNIVNLICKDYDGITITGGEPFDQYLPLMTFLYMLKRKTTLNILCYTGYRLDELEQKFPDKAFYNCIDYLIDGRYNSDTPSSNSLKGSENQHIYKFIDNKPVKTNLMNAEKKWSLKFDDDTIYMAGIPAQNEMKIIADNMLSKGININIV